MEEIVIRAEGLGKKYRIRHEQAGRYTALRDVIADKVRRVFSRTGKPTASESGTAVRSAEIKSAFQANSAMQGTPAAEDFWALRHVSFEVKRGEVVGIIGRNGAGKSTLLKILSRITEPTEGRVELDGRVASLLEVGTGFHPELTGRENVFLNGAILGMGRAEIRRKFDEIVAFAEVERFLDTPVKHYSSGMYVRLAFSVAAHLEPEILVVDEVLAVGDAEFQKKCLGKMRDVSNGGRTVLFVSHNMAAIHALCGRGILLDRGHIIFDGQAGNVVKRYLAADRETNEFCAKRALSRSITLTRFDCRPTVVSRYSSLTFQLVINASTDELISDLAILIHAPSGERAALIDLRSPDGPFRLAREAPLIIHAEVTEIPFVENDFSVGLYINADSVANSFMDLLTFSVAPTNAMMGAVVVPREPQFRGLVELRTSVHREIALVGGGAPGSHLEGRA